TITTPALRGHPSAYATGFLAIAAAVLLYLSPGLVIAGVIVLLLGFLVLDGGWKIGEALLGPATETPRTVGILNGAASLALALIGWLLWRNVGVNAAIGVAVAGYTA